MADTSAIIRSFLAQRIGGSFTDQDDIFALGFVNSLFAMELVVFVEKTFQMRISNEDLTLANFRSVQSVTELVERGAGSSAAVLSETEAASGR